MKKEIIPDHRAEQIAARHALNSRNNKLSHDAIVKRFGRCSLYVSASLMVAECSPYIMPAKGVSCFNRYLN